MGGRSVDVVRYAVMHRPESLAVECGNLSMVLYFIPTQRYIDRLNITEVVHMRLIHLYTQCRRIDFDLIAFSKPSQKLDFIVSCLILPRTRKP